MKRSLAFEWRYQIEDLGTSTMLQALLSIEDNKQFINQGAADALAEGIRDHLAERAQGTHATADRLGATPTGFWENMRNGTVARATASEGTVSMPREMAQKVFGGKLTPQNGSHYITLAAIAAAYGKRVGDFPGLQFGIAFDTSLGVFRPAMVMPDEAVKIKQSGKDRGHTALGVDRTRRVAYFWLTPEVNQKPDPDALPSKDVMGAYAQYGADEAIESLLDKAGDPRK